MKWWRELLAILWLGVIFAPAVGQTLPDQPTVPAQQLPTTGPTLTVDSAPTADAQPGYLGVKADDRGPGDGLRVVEVKPEGPAARAGLQLGDLITAVQGRAVRSLDEFAQEMSQVAAGERVTIDILRGDRRQKLTAVLGRRPTAAVPRLSLGANVNVNSDVQAAPLGLRVEALSQDARRARGGAAGGVQVTRVTKNSAAAKAGIAVDTVIVSIDGQPVSSPDDAARTLGQARVGRPVSFSLIENGQPVERQVLPEASRPSAATVSAAAAGDAVPPEEQRPLTSPDNLAAAHARIAELEERVSDLEQKLSVLQTALEKFRDDVTK